MHLCFGELKLWKIPTGTIHIVNWSCKIYQLQHIKVISNISDNYAEVLSNHEVFRVNMAPVN